MLMHIETPNELAYYTERLNLTTIQPLEDMISGAVSAVLGEGTESIHVELKNDHRVRAYCPICMKWTLLRRRWHSTTTTYVGCEDGSVYPVDIYPTEVDDARYDQSGEFYCADCGEVLFSTEAEVVGYVKGLRDIRTMDNP